MDRQARIDQIIDHFEHPRHCGPLEPADAVHSSNNAACGDVVKVYLRSGDNGGPLTLSYEGQGCTISQAAASMVMEMMQGMTLAQLDAASVEPLLARIGPDIVSTRQRCATLAFNSVKHAAHALKTQQSGHLQTFEVAENLEGLL
jgi:nitrogen fixation NifU-like protein